jgi:geranylgeranyl transferase type-2 subunit beta
VADVFHTFFGVAGLSLLGDLDALAGHEPIDAVYALPERLVRALALPHTTLPRVAS